MLDTHYVFYFITFGKSILFKYSTWLAFFCLYKDVTTQALYMSSQVISVSRYLYFRLSYHHREGLILNHIGTNDFYMIAIWNQLLQFFILELQEYILEWYIIYLQTANVWVVFELAKEDLVGDDVQDMVMFSCHGYFMKICV